jgi:hypothetical protein
MRRQRYSRNTALESLESRALLTTVMGELPLGEVVWTAAENPYRMIDHVTVPEGSTLRIEPGVIVHVQASLELNVRGSLVARGTPEEPIVFTSPPDAEHVPDRPRGAVGLPDGPPRWAGIHFRETRSSDNQLSYVDILYAQSDDGSVGVINSTAELDHISIGGTHLRMIYGNNASLAVRNSVFPDMFAEDEHPVQLGLDNVSEHIKLVGLPPADGQLIIQGNTFGTNRGHNDVIDAGSGLRPGPILQVLDNVFAGTGDELLDLGGDVYVAGNLFQNVTKDADNLDRRFANAISTGDGDARATIVVTRNVFVNIDQTMHVRGGNATIFEHNTVIDVHPPGSGTGAALALFADVGSERPARGAYLWGNLFVGTGAVFGNADQPDGHESQLGFAYNVVPQQLAVTSVAERSGTLMDLGPGNQVGEAQFVDRATGDFRLKTGSSGSGADPFGHDVGALVSTGVWISGEPESATVLNSVNLRVGGPGMFAFRFRLDEGAWSDVVRIGEGFAGVATERIASLQLHGLAPGTHRVEAIGQDFAGNWQESVAVSRRWTVVPGTAGDLNQDNVVDLQDVNLLCAAVLDQSGNLAFDLDGDDEVTSSDVLSLVIHGIGTSAGDANLDGQFNSADLVQIFQRAKYERPGTIATWDDGDWNCDGRFNSGDLVAAFQAGRYRT